MDYMDEFEVRYQDDFDALNDLETHTIHDNGAVCADIDGHTEDAFRFADVTENICLTKKSRKRLDSPTLETGTKEFCSSPKRFKSSGKKFIEDSPEASNGELLGNQKQVTFNSRQSGIFNPRAITVTKLDGSIVHVSLIEDGEYKKVPASPTASHGLLSIPVTTMKEEVFARKENVRICLKNSALHHPQKKHCLEDSELWVEKYRPQSFVELLSDEGVNRVLLSWLKLWDKAVFKRDTKTSGIKTAQLAKRPVSKYKKSAFELADTFDQHGRPLQKVALLYGPPGLGKTTLTHVIARHAGYNVVELNASDDRSPDVFQRSLEAATQMRSVMGEDKRPNCLVIDEIDGAPSASVNLLVSYIQSTGFSKGKKGELPLLMRPIICICNDQYVPALKHLRQIALGINFPFTSKNRLAARLAELAVKEGLKAEMSSLILLCEKSGNDIRSCLSTMQFLCTSRKELYVTDLRGLETGQKDRHQSLFAIWQDIFYFSKANERQTRGLFAQIPNSDSLLKSSFSKILRTVQAYGEYEKIFHGIFQNYLNAKLSALCMELLWKGLEWLCFADVLQNEIWSNQMFLLNSYLPYVAGAFHIFYASSGVPQLSYPSIYYECMSKRSQMMNILTSIISEAVASLKQYCDVQCLVTEVLPSLVDIIKPSLRPVNTHLYSDCEKMELRKVIGTMIAFNLSYRQEHCSDGQYNYVLEPNIEELVSFQGMKPKPALSYAAKQLIAREISVEKMRRSEVEETCQKKKEAGKTYGEGSKAPTRQSDFAPEKPVLDFFGRQVKSVDAKMANKAVESKNHTDIWFHFKEGYSNAVRRTVYMKDLL